MVRVETRAERLAFRWCGLAVLGGVVLGLVEVERVSGGAGLAEVGKLALTSLLLLGKFVIFLGLHDDTPLSPWALALMCWLTDLLIAFALASGLESFERAPVLGRWLRHSRKKAVAFLAEYPALERMAFFGVALFVMLPLAATGAVTGSFAARLIGLGRTAGVLAIAIGSLGTSASFALLARFLGEGAERLAHSPVLTGAVAVVLVVVGWRVFLRVTRKLRKT